MGEHQKGDRQGDQGDRRKLLLLSGAALAVLTTAAAGTVNAFAAGAPTPAQLVAQCDKNTTDIVTCKFTDDVYGGLLGAINQVSDSAYNCTNVAQTLPLSWSDTEVQSNNLNVPVTQGAQLFGAFSGAVAALSPIEFSHTWTGTANVTIPAGSIGMVNFAAPLLQFTGSLDLLFTPAHPYQGKTRWYVDGYTELTPSITDTGQVSSATREMTPAEKTQFCGAATKVVLNRAKAAQVVGAQVTTRVLRAAVIKKPLAAAAVHRTATVRPQ
jgi:hypothetical protein